MGWGGFGGRPGRERNFPYLCSSAGGAGLCSQHRGPWDLLHRLLRVSIYILVFCAALNLNKTQ